MNSKCAPSRFRSSRLSKGCITSSRSKDFLEKLSDQIHHAAPPRVIMMPDFQSVKLKLFRHRTVQVDGSFFEHYCDRVGCVDSLDYWCPSGMHRTPIQSEPVDSFDLMFQGSVSPRSR